MQQAQPDHEAVEPPPASREPGIPQRIGRFTRLRPLGDGGMGVVYTAHDEGLEREVAVKVLRTDGSPRHAEHHARMAREARLLAQLSHPNVVTVHEVGEHEGQIFIAMELVRGKPLGAWLEQHRRERHGKPDWRAVLGVFVQAGAGLAAAHQAGLVHRDFKPSNAMVGDDGTVKVVDFGLARDATRDETLTSSNEARTHERPPGSIPAAESVTRTGSVLGTPAYMAPEQHLGRPADDRSDQFSFCVALYEALYGHRPFEGDTLIGLQQSVLAGRVRETPRRSPVPRRVRRLLLRGLALHPEDRHSSLTGLLRALDRDPMASWRGGATVGGLVLLASAGAFALASHDASKPVAPCAAIDGELASIWNDERRAAVEAAFEATSLSYAAETWHRVGPTLDAYAKDWLSMRAESCQAYARGLETTQHYDLRTTCLARRRTALDTLVSLLSEATREDVERAIQAASGLPRLAACADLEALTSAFPPPEEPVLANAVAKHRDTLAQAREHEMLGRLDEARRLVEPVIAAAEATKHPPLQAEALLVLGTVELSGRRHATATELFSQALATSLRTGHVEIAAEAFARRIYTMGQIGRGEEALQDLALAKALVERTDDDQLRWLLLNNAGVTYMQVGRDDEARALLDEALAVTERANGQDHFQYAVSLGNIGIIPTMYDSRVAAAQEARGLEILVGTLGRYHPHAIWLTGNLAGTETELGRLAAPYERLASLGHDVQAASPFHWLARISNERESHAEALVRVDECLERSESAEGTLGHYFHTACTAQRATALAALHRHDEAMAVVEAALPIPAGTLYGDVMTALLLTAKGEILLEHGEATEALLAHREALAALEASSSVAPSSVSPTLLAESTRHIAASLHALGDGANALELAWSSLRRLREEMPCYPKEVVAHRQTLGDILLDMNRPEEALAQYELGHREFSETADHDHPRLAKLELGMARARVEASGDDPESRAHAEAHAHRALATFRRYAAGFADEAAAAERLLRDELKASP